MSKGTVLNDLTTVQQLVREGVHEVQLTPETPVLCIHRGRRHTEDGAPVHHENAARHRDGEREAYFEGDYKDTYDGFHYIIAPGYFSAPYGAALHFQRRAVVPGSRNPETGFQASFIAIIGVVELVPGGGFRVLKPVDDQVDWTPFTDEECAQYEVAFEALDRAAMVAPIEKEVVLRNVSETVAGGKAGSAKSRVKGGGGKGGRRGTQQEVTDERIRKPIPPHENSSVREAQAGRAAGAGAASGDAD
jgi:hypothetical protein